MKKVSIIVPVYNVSKFLKDCLDSILSQTYPNIELIIIEDKSTDNSLAILKEYQEQYPFIKLLTNDVNKGLSYTRNRGLEIATGEYISFIDSDDIIEPDFIELIVNSMELNNTSIGICSYNTFFNKPKKNQGTADSYVIDYKEDMQSFEKIFGACWNKIYTREIIDDLRFPVGLKFEDFPFVYPLLAKAKKVSVVSDNLYHYRRNFTGISITSKRIAGRGTLDLYKSCQTLEKNYNLVKEDNTFDHMIMNMAHKEMLKMALDASLWTNIDIKRKKEIVNLLYCLANRYFNYDSHDESEFIKRAISQNKWYKFRFYCALLYIDKLYKTDLSDSEILTHIEDLIKESKTNKCKEKRK